MIQGQEEISVPVRPFYDNQIEQKLSFVACGGYHTLALASDNTVYSWGSNQFGQLGLALDEFDSFYTPKSILFFKEKIISYLSAGSHHSLALSIEGYSYTWGRNDYGQLGHGNAVSIKSDSKIPCPKIVENVLGIGIAQASCNYNNIFLGCADKLKNKPESDVFNVWKSKLKKHEERMQIEAT